MATGMLSASPLAAQDNGTQVLELLEELVTVPGVSGREEAVRTAILDRLPAWARAAAQTDAMGNLSVTTGSGEPWVLYVAHMDEIGYMVTHIRDDGRIQVQKHGDFYDRQYEGRLVEIHTANGPVSGVVVMPSTHLRRGLAQTPEPFTVESVLIDVGTESRAETEALGVALLDPITVPKTITRLAGTRLAARSMDDRFGCAALLAVAQRIRPQALRGTLTLAWSTQEEVGLRGAEALAAEMSPHVVVPVDTFVTSDSPVESPRVGFAELGGGPAIRALDQSNIAPIALVRALLGFAESQGLALRYGATMGGNDGSVFRNVATAVLPIGIPIRYSHTAIETIDGRDLAGLADLLEAMVLDVSWAEAAARRAD
jgi:putative aminopeptidase FrvX